MYKWLYQPTHTTYINRSIQIRYMRRSGLEKSITIIIVLIIGLAVGLVIIVMTNDNLKSFFTGSDEVNDENIDILKCDSLCFQCCMTTPDKCDGPLKKDELLDCPDCNC